MRRTAMCGWLSCRRLPQAIVLLSCGILTQPVAAQENDSVAAKPLRTGKVGLAAVTRDFQSGQRHWAELFTQAKSMGVQVLALQPGIWSKAEPQPGVYRTKSTENVLRAMDRHGVKFELTKDIAGPFFMDRVTAPADIKFKSFTDSVLLKRYQAFIGSFLRKFGTRINHLVIHAEGSHLYFRKHPQQLGDYCRFLKLMTEFVHQRHPAIRVGVNVYPRNTDKVISSMAQSVDFLAFDYMSGKRKSPQQFPRAVARMIQLAGGKPIAIQYAAWSTSKVDQSSEEEQVQFIREYFRTLEIHRRKILYAAFARVFDNDMKLTRPGYRAAFPRLTEGELDRIVDSMCHFGLRRADGTPKPGWHAFIREANVYYSRR